MKSPCFVLVVLAVLDVFVLPAHAAETLPKPDTSRMEPAVRKQVEEEMAAVSQVVADPKAEPAALAEAFGRCGRQLAAYELSEGAQECFGKAARYAPQDPRWPYYLGALAQKRSDLDGARSFFERALALQPGDPSTLLRLAELDLSAGRLPAAQARFQELLDRDPAFAAAALDGLGRVAMQGGDAKTAAERFEAALARQPQASLLHYQLGMAYRKLGEADKARLHLSQYGQIAVKAPDPLIEELARLNAGVRQHVIAGTKAFQAGQFATAMDEYRQALAADPGNADVWANLGAALQKQGDAAGAEESYRRAVAANPNHARAHYNLGTLLAARGERREGIEHLEAAVRLDPEGKGARFNLATALMEAGEPARALAQYDEIIRRTPADAMAHYQRGLALLALQKPEEALGELQAVAEAAPGAVEPQVGLARALAALGRFGEAAAAQGRAAELAEKAGRPEAGALRACWERYQAGRGCS
jgi:tetratricopeptide (TPR) repeat protein